MVEAALTPLSPFSKGEVSFQDSNPSLEKHALSVVEGRGRGDFGRREGGNYVANFWVRTLANREIILL